MRKTALSLAISAAPLPPAARGALLRACRVPRSTVKPFLAADPAGGLAALALLLREGAAALGLSEENALFAGGFDPADAEPERLGAAFAELQAASFLVRAGAEKLRLLPTGKAATADLCGSWRGTPCVFEVRSLHRKGGPLEYLFGRAGTAAPAEAVAYLCRKVDKKLPQVRRSGKCAGGASGVLVFSACLFREAPAGRLEALAGAVHAAKGSPPDLSVALLAGRGGACRPSPGARG